MSCPEKNQSSCENILQKNYLTEIRPVVVNFHKWVKLRLIFLSFVAVLLYWMFWTCFYQLHISVYIWFDIFFKIFILPWNNIKNVIGLHFHKCSFHIYVTMYQKMQKLCFHYKIKNGYGMFKKCKPDLMTIEIKHDLLF